MGCEQSRPTTPTTIPSFRDRARVSWFVTNSEWRTFVEQTYTPEFCKAHQGKIDCYEIWKDMQQAEVGDKCIIGRQIWMGEDYVSYGRVLVSKDYWHSYEGIWSASDTSFTSGQKQEFRVQIPEEGGLVCTCTATGTVVWKRSATASKPNVEDQAEGGTGNAEAQVECKSEKDGDVQVLLGDQWVPGELHLHSYGELTVTAGGKTLGTFTRELALIGPEYKQLDGEDWVFGNVTPNSEVMDENNAKFMTLHLCRVDVQKSLLQVVCHLGRRQEGRIGSITMPIPQDKMSDALKQCCCYSCFRKPMIFNGYIYRSEDQMMKVCHQWMMFDLALRMSEFAVLHYGLVYSAQAGALATGLETGLNITLNVAAVLLTGEL